MGTVGMTRELKELGGLKLQNLLEAAADGQEDFSTLVSRPALAAGHIPISTARNALSYGASPEADTEEGLPHIHNNAHDFAVVLSLEGLANGGEHGVEPEFVNVDVALVLEAVRPLAAVLVLGVLPLGPHTLLE